MTLPSLSQGIGRLDTGDFIIDPQLSTVTLKTRHLFGLGRVRGVVELGRGAIHVANPVTRSTTQASILAATFRTGNAARDSVVRSPRMLDAATHPTITFDSNGIEQIDTRWILHGFLCVRGVNRPVDLDISKIESTKAGLRVVAVTRVDRYEFGLTKSKGLASRHLDIEIDVVAGRA
jgi:polyisoprenoid-binding protein YceI